MKPRLVIALIPFAFACSSNEPVAPDMSPSYARGGPGGGGGGQAPAITPVQLGNLKQINCTGTEANSINDATPSTVGGDCVRGGTVHPFLWSTTSVAVHADTGIVREVALDGAGFGEMDFKPFKWRIGSAAVLLPLPPARTWGSVSAINANGTFAFGDAQWSEGNNGFSEPSAWSFDGSTWSISSISFYASDATPSGLVAAGQNGGHAARWTSSGGTWSAQTLPDEGAISSRAIGINQEGSVLVGEIVVPLTSDPTRSHSQQVAWVADGSGGFTLRRLGGLNVVEGSAVSVATQTDGSVIAVGEAWEDLPGAKDQLWAVAWKLPLGASQFNAPTRLSPAASGARAWATDINSHGEIVGTSYTKTSTVAVMWKL